LEIKIHTHHQFKIENHQSWKRVCVSPRNNHKIWWIHNFTKIFKTNLHLFKPSGNNEPINYEKLLEAITQAQIDHNHDIDIKVKTLHSHPLTIPDVSNHFVRAKESCYFGNQDSISAYPFELDQTSNFENPINILASYHFPEIELENEYDPEPQIVIQFHFLIQCWLRYLYLTSIFFPSQHWILCQYIMKLNHQSLWSSYWTWPISYFWMSHWRIGKFSFLWNWTQTRMWLRFSNLWFSLNFWINIDSCFNTRLE